MLQDWSLFICDTLKRVSNIEHYSEREREVAQSCPTLWACSIFFPILKGKITYLTQISARGSLCLWPEQIWLDLTYKMQNSTQDYSKLPKGSCSQSFCSHLGSCCLMYCLLMQSLNLDMKLNPHSSVYIHTHTRHEVFMSLVTNYWLGRGRWEMGFVLVF